ncbi:MAG: MBL fold metallo-hydrolase [Acetobacteraceae bacterium]|nr:MBL fold metallo-hydrolase [Acetobacteraceae bacterium]
MTAKPLNTAQTTRLYRRHVGSVEVTSVLDGYVELSNGVWRGIEPDAIDRALRRRHLPTGGIRNGITSFLINTGTALMMVDAGAAGLFGPHSSGFPANLAGSGVAPADVDAVLITHLHPDHIGALIASGAATLPKAVLRVNAVEVDFWTSETEQSRAPEYMRSWFDLARSVLAAYDSRVETFTAGQALGGGISTVAQPGHTPGHAGFLLESEGQSLMFWGDLAVSAAIQFPNPAAHMLFDIDSAAGHRSRLRGFDQAAADGLLTVATHLPFPTFGYVERRDGAYEWIPEEWRYDVTGAPLQPVM